MWYHVFCVGLEIRTLVSCGGLLKLSCVGGGGSHSYVGVGVNLVRVIAARRSLRILFTLILLGSVLPIFLIIFRVAFFLLTGK